MAELVTVFIVDDNIATADLVQKFLEMHDRVRVVGRADNGIAALEGIGKLRPDVVLLDIIMPQLDGYGVLEKLSSGYCGEYMPKVIAVTASKVKSNSASMGFGGTMGATNNEVAKNEIAEKLEDIQDVEW